MMTRETYASQKSKPLLLSPTQGFLFLISYLSNIAGSIGKSRAD